MLDSEETGYDKHGNVLLRNMRQAKAADTEDV